MDAIKKLTQFLQLLPGVGPRTAQRYVYYLLNQPEKRLDELAEIISILRSQIKQCKKCFTFSSKELCEICSSLYRDQSLLCVVAKPQDIESINKAEIYHGLYFVLGGLLHPLLGIEPKDLRFEELKERLRASEVPVKELILAINPTLEGENTIHYIKKLFEKHLIIKISVLARGLPQGSDLEYADEITLSEALKYRKEI